MFKRLGTPLFLLSASVSSGMSFPMNSFAANPPPAAEPDYSSVLDMQASPEEHMVNGDMPTPENGSENAEDLLKSAPSLRSSPTKKSAGLPKALPVRPDDSHLDAASTATDPNADLPPLPETSNESLSPTAAEPTTEALPDANDDSRVSDSAGSSTRKWDRSVPLYDRENPNWGVEFHGSLAALGNPGIVDTQSTSGDGVPIKNFGIGFEYEPSFLQSAGVFSIGPSLNLYYVDDATVTKSAFSVYSAGLSAKYQFKYWRGQPFVPFVGFEAQMIRYSLIDGPSGTTLSKGLTAGGMLLLNWMEPSAAHNLYSDHGIKRTYLVGEAKIMTADDELFSVDGVAIYLGIRMEY